MNIFFDFLLTKESNQPIINNSLSNLRFNDSFNHSNMPNSHSMYNQINTSINYDPQTAMYHTRPPGSVQQTQYASPVANKSILQNNERGEKKSLN